MTMWMVTSGIVLLLSTVCHGVTEIVPNLLVPLVNTQSQGETLYTDLQAEGEMTCDVYAPIPDNGFLGCTAFLANWDFDYTKYTKKYQNKRFRDGKFKLTGLDLSSVMMTENPANWYSLYNWDQLEGCNKAGSMCTRPVKCTVVQRYTAQTIRDNIAQGYQKIDYDYSRVCLICPPLACTPAEINCKNGQVLPSPGLIASSVTNAQGVNVVYRKPRVKLPCAAGYWLTCQNSDAATGCEYIPPNMDMIRVVQGESIPSREKQNQIGLWIAQNRAAYNQQLPVPMTVGWGLLVDRCYPCLYANGVSHYGGAVILTDSVLMSQGYLSFYCPGADSAPVPCPVNTLSRINPSTNTSSECKCKPGYYQIGDRCDLCPAGQFCVFGSAPQNCTTDHYSLSGASACTPCRTDTGVCGANFALRRCIGGPAFQNRDADCVDCQSCQTGSVSAGSVPCQRVGVPAQV